MTKTLRTTIGFRTYPLATLSTDPFLATTCSTITF